MIPSDLPSWAVAVSCCNASVFCSPTSSRFSTLNDPLLRPLANVSSVFRADGWGDCGRPAAWLKDLTLALSCSSSYHCSAYGESYKKLLLLSTISEEMFLKGLQGVKDEASCCISKSLLAWSSGTASLPIPIFTNIYCFSAEAACTPSKS